jgi:hypothetical protein
MNPNLWNDQTTASDSTNAATTTASEQSPLTAAIEASEWSRQDIELALHVAQVGLLAAWVFLIYQND